MNNTENMSKEVQVIVFLSVVFGACMLLVSLVYFKSVSMAQGVFFGCVLGIANLIFLTKIVVKMFNQNYKRKLVILLFIGLKFLFIAVVLGLSFWVFRVNVKGFAAGYLCLILAMMVGQLLGFNKVRVDSC